MSATTSPVRLDARLDGPGRGLWLVKWLLLVPHLVVLCFLWLAFGVLTVVAFFVILFTGRYPQLLFDFNLGVLRWTWRAWCYGYGALATDRYPPFSLGAEPDYPATLDIDYPERLTRGLVLVKWLLALPHYLVVAFFAGGGGFVLWQWGSGWLGFDGGLVTLLSVFAGMALLFTGRYPTGIFDLVMGMNRWVLRVGAYAALMTDEYPPFRLDLGGRDPGTSADDVVERPQETRASPGRTAGVVLGALLMVLGLGGTVGGGALLWLDGQRDSGGYVEAPVERLSDNGYALRFDTDDVMRWDSARKMVGDVRVRLSTSESGETFVGVARTGDVDRYLDALSHRRFQRPRGDMPRGEGMWRAPDRPMMTGFWDDTVVGSGPLTMNWTPRPGSWSLVVMNADAHAGVDATIGFAATAPTLRPIAITTLSVGVVVLVAGVAAVVLASRTRRRI